MTPWSRPVVRYPVNHHLAQILERAVVIAGYRWRACPVRGRPVQRRRAGAARPVAQTSAGSAIPGRGGSPFCRCESSSFRAPTLTSTLPSIGPGAGTDQHKWSVSGRWDGAVGHYPVYGLVEWARTSEAEGFFVFHSFLAEGAWTVGRSRLHYRFERTERPEEERTLDPFRSVRPHFENSILGITRWTIHTLGYGVPAGAARRRLRALPFVEMSYGRMADVGGGLFDVRSFYGGTRSGRSALVCDCGLGMRMHRMGRYGVAQDTAAIGGEQCIMSIMRLERQCWRSC